MIQEQCKGGRSSVNQKNVTGVLQREAASIEASKLIWPAS